MAEKIQETTSPQFDGTLSKMEAVRRAIKTLGNDAMPLDIQKHLLEKYGLDMITNHISSYKTDILKKRVRHPKPSLTKTTVAKPAAQPPEAKKQEAPKAAAKSTASNISLVEIETTKELVEQVGAANLKALIDLLSK